MAIRGRNGGRRGRLQHSGAVPLRPFRAWRNSHLGRFHLPRCLSYQRSDKPAVRPEGRTPRVLVGFGVAVLLSIWLATPRLALASGMAFLSAQLLDVVIF